MLDFQWKLLVEMVLEVIGDWNWFQEAPRGGSEGLGGAKICPRRRTTPAIMGQEGPQRGNLGSLGTILNRKFEET